MNGWTDLDFLNIERDRILYLAVSYIYQFSLDWIAFRFCTYGAIDAIDRIEIEANTKNAVIRSITPFASSFSTIGTAARKYDASENYHRHTQGWYHNGPYDSDWDTKRMQHRQWRADGDRYEDREDEHWQ